MKKIQYRHGDLLLESIGEIPAKTKLKKDKILLEGEITGHMHEVIGEAKVYETAKKIYLEVLHKSRLIHPEHSTIELNPGKYKVTRQREFDAYEGIKQVID